MGIFIASPPTPFTSPSTFLNFSSVRQRIFGSQAMPPSMAIHSRHFSPPPDRPPAPEPAAEPLRSFAAGTIEEAVRRDSEWQATVAANIKLLAAASELLGHPSRSRKTSSIGRIDLKPPPTTTTTAAEVEPQASSDAACVRLAAAAAAVEPTVTQMLQACAADGRLHRLEHRLKLIPSMRAKLASLATNALRKLREADPSATNEAAEQLVYQANVEFTPEKLKCVCTDALRYTVVLSEDGYAAGVAKVRADITARGGHVVERKNFCAQPQL